MPTDQYSFWEFASYKLWPLLLDLYPLDPLIWLDSGTLSIVCWIHIFWSEDIACALLVFLRL